MIFDAFDADQDGRLTRAEFATYVATTARAYLMVVVVVVVMVVVLLLLLLPLLPKQVMLAPQTTCGSTTSWPSNRTRHVAGFIFLPLHWR